MEINRGMLLQSFREETEECLAQMEQSLLALETRPDDRELISSLFRGAYHQGQRLIVGVQRSRAIPPQCRGSVGPLPQPHRCAVTGSDQYLTSGCGCPPPNGQGRGRGGRNPSSGTPGPERSPCR